MEASQSLLDRAATASTIRMPDAKALLSAAHALEKKLNNEYASCKPTDPEVVEARAKLRDTFRSLILDHHELA